MSLLIGESVFCQSFRLEGNIPANEKGTEIGQLTIFSMPDSSLIKGTYLDSSYFSLLIASTLSSDYYVKINLPGYVDTLINFHCTDSVMNLGIVNLQKNVVLDIVNVVYQKPLFVPTIDGINVNVAGTTLETLDNLFDVLKSSPKIMSPDGESIEIIGKGVPLILIDRLPVLSNNELKAIPASMIERIEIITNPSAKYRAEGRGNGVIEVYTKNFRFQGYNMSINTSGGVNTQLRPTGVAGIGFSFRKNKFSLNAYLNMNYLAQNSFGTIIQTNTDSSNRIITTNGGTEIQRLSQGFNLKSSYQINETKIFTAGIRSSGLIDHFESSNNSSYRIDQVEKTESERAGESKKTWLNNSAFLNYSWETDTNKSYLEINFNYQLKVDEGSDVYRTNFTDLQNQLFSQFEIRNVSKNRPNIGELRITYEHVFDTSGWKLSVGGSYSIIVNGMKFDASKLVQNDWIINQAYSNSYDYYEQIGGAFAELTKAWKKVTIRAGIRGEYTGLNGYSHSLSKQFMDSSYVLPFPSGSIMYSPAAKVTMTARYTSGIDRPLFSYFDPFVRVIDSLNIEYGNPYLRPATNHSFGFDLDLFYKYRLSVDYSLTHNPMTSFEFIEDSSFRYVYTPWNADRSQQTSLSLNLPLKAKWMDGWNSLSIVYSKYEFTPIFNRADYSNITFVMWSILNFHLKGNVIITSQLGVYRLGDYGSTHNTRARWTVKVTKKMFNNNLRVFLEVSDIIPPEVRSNQTGSNFESSSTVQTVFTSFKIGIFYKFGRLKQDTQIQESSSGQSGRI